MLVELPITVVPRVRLPFIGTTIVMMPDKANDIFARAVLASPQPVNLELHAIDFLDHSDPGVAPELSARQRDLQVPAAIKVARLQAVIQQLSDARRVVTLRDLARRPA